MPLNVDPIHASASLGTWEVDIIVTSQPRDHARRSTNTTAVAEAIGLIQMAMGGLAPFTVYCDMNDKKAVGQTVIGLDSESRKLVRGYNRRGGYLRDIHYTGASLSQLASLTRVPSHCEQFIKHECYNSVLLYNNNFDGRWVSRDSTKMRYWGGAFGNGKCACGMTNSCADSRFGCNCDKNDNVWREGSGLPTDKTKLPVKQLKLVILVTVARKCTTPLEN